MGVERSHTGEAGASCGPRPAPRMPPTSGVTGRSTAVHTASTWSSLAAPPCVMTTGSGLGPTWSVQVYDESFSFISYSGVNVLMAPQNLDVKTMLISI